MFIALLLPLDARDYAPPAEAVLAGCRAALDVAGDKPALQVVRTDASNLSILAGYAAATARGASVVVGPMTRSGATRMAASSDFPVPTLALNAPEEPTVLPKNMYTFGLSVDAEARQVARTARAENLHDALIVRSASPLSRRAARAFGEEWTARGGKLSHVAEFDAQTDLAQLQERLAKYGPHAIFLSADPQEARRVRPYLNSQVPVFATSQVNSGQADALINLDLNGTRFVEMPWLLQPDNVIAMIYPRTGVAPELQRFYALGIDACRIAEDLRLRGEVLPLHGITGTLVLRPDGAVEREAQQAVFRDGAAVPFEQQ